MFKYDQEQRDLEKRITELEEQTENVKTQNIQPERFIELIRKYKDVEELTRPMVRELIDKVIVYPPEGHKPSRTQKVEIYFNFIGQFELAYTPEELEEIRLSEEEENRKRAEHAEEICRKDYERQKKKREMRRAQRYALYDGHPYPKKICPICGNEFCPNLPYKIYCCEVCHKMQTMSRQDSSGARIRPRTKHVSSAAVCSDRSISSSCSVQILVSKNTER